MILGLEKLLKGVVGETGVARFGRGVRGRAIVLINNGFGGRSLAGEVGTEAGTLATAGTEAETAAEVAATALVEDIFISNKDTGFGLAKN